MIATTGFNLVIENLLISTPLDGRSYRTCFNPQQFRARQFSMGMEIIEKHDELVQSTTHNGFHLSLRSKGFLIRFRP